MPFYFNVSIDLAISAASFSAFQASVSTAASCRACLCASDSALEPSRIDANHPGVGDVVADRQVFLHFVELGADRHVDRVLLAVDHLELKGVVDFGEGHRRRRRAHGAEEFDPQGIVRHSQLQALEVVRLGDRLAANW